jgi:RNA polymerase sigma-70 factor (ECF subfamily)
MPLVSKWAKIMFEAYLTIANRSGSASPAEIANRRKIIHNFIRARITDAATVDDLRCVRAFVEALPDDSRVALELVDFEGISQVELAKRFGLTVSTAKSRVQRARARLRALIDACCEVDTDVYGNFIDCRRRGEWLPCD